MTIIALILAFLLGMALVALSREDYTPPAPPAPGTETARWSETANNWRKNAARGWEEQAKWQAKHAQLRLENNALRRRLYKVTPKEPTP